MKQKVTEKFFLLTLPSTSHIMTPIEPNTPLNDADHVGSFFNLEVGCVEDLKQHQPSMTIEEQIENLKSKGLMIADEQKAAQVLNEISYFRLIKAYSLNLKEYNGLYYEGTGFETLVNLYHFNSGFRHLLFPKIETIEIMVRCRISNYFANKYGVLGYLKKEHFENTDYYNAFIQDVKREIGRNTKTPFVKNFNQNYVGGDLPIYALVEILSFGTLSKLFKNMLNTDKKAVAQTFGVRYTYFESWLESLSFVRNICAHYGRLYNAKLTKKPKLYNEYSSAGIGNNQIYGILLCMKHIFKSDPGWQSFVNQLEALFEEYKDVNISTMGFPKNWKHILITFNTKK